MLGAPTPEGSFRRMTDPQLVVGRSPVRTAPSDDITWRAFLWTGLAFVLVGGMDLALVWYPARFGLPEFEFASATATLNSMPVLTMGMALAVAGARGGGIAWVSWAMVLAAGLVLLFVMAVSVLFALTVPLALRAEVAPEVLTGLKKQAVKGTVQVVVYVAIYVLLGRLAYRAARST